MGVEGRVSMWLRSVETELDERSGGGRNYPRQHRRDGLRCAIDLTGAEWAMIAPLLPPPAAFACRETVLDRHRARHLLLCPQ
jgi:hypothetical protein